MKKTILLLAAMLSTNVSTYANQPNPEISMLIDTGVLRLEEVELQEAIMASINSPSDSQSLASYPNSADNDISTTNGNTVDLVKFVEDGLELVWELTSRQLHPSYRKSPTQYLNKFLNYHIFADDDTSTGTDYELDDYDAFTKHNMMNNIMLEVPYNASETDLVNKLGETLQNIQPNTAIEIIHSDIGRQEPQIYQHPDNNTTLVRVETGGYHNMCPLLSLGALPVNSREEAEMLIRQIIEGIKLLATTIDPLILSNPERTSPTLAQWEKRAIRKIPDDIFDSESGINYERLWGFLHGIDSKSSNRPGMIVDDDPLWWPVMAQVLNANIHFFQMYQQGELIHSHNVIIPGATREIYIAARPGHYTMLLPPNPQQIMAEMRRNLPYNPIF